VLLPGFVNAHTHAGMTHMRGMAEDMVLSDWLSKKVGHPPHWDAKNA